MDLPKDTMMLLSFVNTQLRDNYDSLAEFCQVYEADEAEIIEKLGSIDYEYDAQLNKFI